MKEGNNRIVVPDPEISAFSPSRKDQFIIVATDGLWDVMSSQSAVEYVNNILVDEDLLGMYVYINTYIHMSSTTMRYSMVVMRIYTYVQAYIVHITLNYTYIRIYIHHSIFHCI